MKTSNLDKTDRLLKIAASSLAIIIPAVLLAGYSYHLGFSLTFGLHTDLISKSMSDVLAQSWYIGVFVIGWVISRWYFLVAYALILCFLCLCVFLWHRNQIKNDKDNIFLDLNEDNQGRLICGISQWHWTKLISIFTEIFSFITYPIVIGCFIGMLLFLPFEYGKKFAKQNIQIIQKNDHQCSEKITSCVYLVDTSKVNRPVVASGILVSANDKRIAIYREKLEVWPILDNYLLVQETQLLEGQREDEEEMKQPEDDVVNKKQ